MCELFPVILQYTYKVPLTLLVRKNDLKADDFPRCSYTLVVLILEFHSGKELELFLSLCKVISSCGLVLMKRVKKTIMLASFAKISES